MKKLKIVHLLLLLFLNTSIQAQYYNLGQDPSSTKWRQIETGKFKLIYPETFELRAQKLILTLNEVYKKNTVTLNYYPKQIPIIIHPYNTEPNALTIWAPKRVELYTCPPQDSYAQDWLTQLAIHEYRHVVQIDRANQGFTKILTYILGQQASAAINGMFVPTWFLEGDAVCAETAFSKVGRGRLPSFEMPVKAQVIEKGIYSYSKAVFGSYKTHVPNKYEMGYILVAQTRNKYGYQTWITALDEVAKRPFRITPFSNGIKKATGKRLIDLYSESFKHMDSLWKTQVTNSPKTPFIVLNKAISNFENLTFPKYINDSVIIALYSSPDFITSIVQIVKDKPKFLYSPGYLSSESFTYCNDLDSALNHEKIPRQDEKSNPLLLCWTERINDIRWEMRNYSDIMLYDLRTKKLRRLTKKGRYFSPAFSSDRKKLVATKITSENQCSIVLIDPNSGKELSTFIASEDDVFLTPKWRNDGEKIIFIKIGKNGKSMHEMDTKSLKTKELLPPGFVEISHPSYAGAYILFNGSYSETENVYAIDTLSKAIFQVTSASFGACNASLNISGTKICYSDYNSNGYRIVESAFAPEKWTPQQIIKNQEIGLYIHILKEEPLFVEPDNPDSTTYNISKPYKKGRHIFNFHSWAPTYINYAKSEYGPGISLMSQNDLSTATTIVGYHYDLIEQTSKATIDFSWDGWFPKIDLNASYGNRVSYTNNDTSVKFTFSETILNVGTSIPMLFTGGKYYKFIQFGASTSYYQISNNTSPENKKLRGTIHSLNYQLTAYRFIKQATKDLYPKWGQVFIGYFRHTPIGDNNLGNIFAAETRCFFPGLLRNHGLRIDLRYQHKSPGDYSYNNLVSMPRGYLLRNYNQMKVVAVNYKFPLAYPDFNAGNLMYLKRIKATVFADIAKGIHGATSERLFSFGTEITSDIHFFRFLFPFDVGMRLGYKPSEKQFFSDLLFSLNLSL